MVTPEWLPPFSVVVADYRERGRTYNIPRESFTLARYRAASASPHCIWKKVCACGERGYLLARARYHCKCCTRFTTGRHASDEHRKGQLAGQNPAESSGIRRMVIHSSGYQGYLVLKARAEPGPMVGLEGLRARLVVRERPSAYGACTQHLSDLG